MESRKLIRFGKNSYVLSMPKLWVNKNKLKKGDSISIEENREGLLLKTNNLGARKEDPKIMALTADGKTLEMLKTEIVSAYLENCDIVEVISKDMKTNAPQIKAILHDLSGMEIINQSATKIVAKDLIDINEIPVKTLIRRMDNITRSMLEDTSYCFEGKEDPENVMHRDEDVNRLHFLSYRIIRSALKDVRVANSLGTTPLKLHSDNIVTTKIERIADNTKRICRYINYINLDEKWKKDLRDLFENIKLSYLDVMKAYYTNDEKIALRIEEANEQWIRECDTFFDEHHRKPETSLKPKKAGICNSRLACGSTAKIMENMKEMASGIKYIARTIIGGA